MAHSPGKGMLCHPHPAYAPTLDAEHNIKEDFYRALDAILQKTPATDRLKPMGDFNARVGTEHLVWAKVIGQHGVGKMNHNGPSVQSTSWSLQTPSSRLTTSWSDPNYL